MERRRQIISKRYHGNQLSLCKLILTQTSTRMTGRMCLLAPSGSSLGNYHWVLIPPRRLVQNQCPWHMCCDWRLLDQPAGVVFKWPSVYLDHNSIGNNGAKLLAKAKMPKLKLVNLCNCKLTQYLARSRQWESGTSARAAGQTYPEYSSVSVGLPRQEQNRTEWPAECARIPLSTSKQCWNWWDCCDRNHWLAWRCKLEQEE